MPGTWLGTSLSAGALPVARCQKHVCGEGRMSFVDTLTQLNAEFSVPNNLDIDFVAWHFVQYSS